MPTVHEDSVVEEVQVSKKKTTKRRQSKKAGNNEDEEDDVQEVRQPMNMDIARKKVVASPASSKSGYDALAWLMVNECVDLTQTYKERKSKNVETFIVIRKREVELRIQEIKMREVAERRQGLQFYLQPHDHFDGQ
nr:hypothetical protein [Tanacetum cinerariifolium]